MRNHWINSGRGFSLVELLVVISIIATLTAVLLPNFMGARDKATDSQHIQDLSALKSALRNYYNDNQAYPTGSPGVGVTLGAAFATYYPAVVNLGYTYEYYQTKNGDGFLLCQNLLSRGGEASMNSLAKCDLQTVGAGATNFCKMGAGTTNANVFTICAN